MTANRTSTFRILLLLLLPSMTLHGQTGSVDAGFDPGFPNTNVYTAALQTDGKIIIGGAFTNVAGLTRNRLARLNPNGTVDAGFNPNASGDVNAIAVQDDGKILIGGAFTNVVATTRNRLARLNADGTLDAGFNPNASNVVNSIVLQPDGKIIFGGNFTGVGALIRNRLARLNTDGTLDTNFNPNASSNVLAMALQLDGKILVGGDFTNVAATARNYFARINADGTVDAAFNPNASNSVYNATVQADGKIIIGGAFTGVAATLRNRMARLNTNGTLDATFNPNASNVVNSVVLQADGMSIVGGVFTNLGATVRNRIARLNTNGSLESTFDPNAGGVVSGVTVQGDGKVIVGGTFTNVGVTLRTNLARLQNDAATQNLAVTSSNRIEWLRGGAAPEASRVTFDFSTDGGLNWIALGSGSRISGGWEITGLILPDSGLLRGRARVPGGIYNGSSGLVEANNSFSGLNSWAPLVTTGNATNVTDVSASLTASINPAGSPTTARFEYGTTTNYGSVAGITLSPTNGATTQNITNVISGLTPGTTYHFRATASNSVGLTLGADQTFDTPLYPDIAVEQPAGTNLVAGIGTISFGASLVGLTNSPKTFLIRNLGLTNLLGLVITKDGVHSNDFILNTNGMSATLAPGSNTSFTLAFAAGATGFRTGAVHIASSDPDENPFDIALLGSGYRPGDVETNLTAGAGSTVQCAAVQPDGKILIGGDFTTVGGLTRTRIARLNADGTVEATNTFNPVTAAPSSTVYGIGVQADGKILLGGFFSSVNGVTRSRIARLNADGTLDAGFDPVASTTVYCVAVQADGKILIGGDFLTVGGVARNRIARLNTNGTLDTNFNPNASSTVYSIALQGDGKIILGGDFATVGGLTRTRVARLNADGSVESTNTFNPVTAAANSIVYSTAVQPDGKILLGGLFGTVGGVTRNRNARLNADGTLDASFNPNVNGTVFSMVMQTDGKIVLGGGFTTIGVVARNFSARLNGDGSLDTNFNPNANNTVQATALQADGKVIIGGNFSTVSGLGFTNLARLQNDAATQSLTVPSASRVEWLRGEASPEAQGVGFDFSTDGGTNWVALGAGVRIVNGWELTGLSLPPSGLVRARARVSGGSYNGSSSLIETNASFSGFVALAPLVATGGSTNITDVLATLFASVNPAGAATTARFEYGPTTNYGSVAAITLSPTNGATTQAVSSAISALTPGTTYHYRVAASNSVGTTFGGDATFETLLYPDIAVEQPVGTNLVDGVSTNSLGLNLLGTTNAPRAFLIRNVGLTNLTGLAITKDGVHSNDFIVDTSGMSTSLAPGASTVFNVIFATGATGTRTAAIHIANNDPDENPFDIALTGFGYVPGDVETNFNPNATGGSVYGLAIQPDGKMIVGGDFTAISLPARSILARLNVDGTVDPPFTNANISVQCAAVQPDGKVVIGGDFTSISGVSRTRIARLNTNGTLDLTFSNNVNSTVNGLALQPDGKILIAGQFTLVSGVSHPSLTRLNTDGSLDAGFAATTANQNVSTLALLPDGKIMIGGSFWLVGGVSRTNLARLNSNGTLDLTFSNSPNSTVLSMVVQPDGKVVIGGSFTAINATTRNRFARFNTDGTLDSLDLNANGDVNGIALQTDGKIIVGGSFFNVKGATTRNNIARLNADGTLDSFNPNAGSTVYGLAIQPDGKIIVGGFFTTMNGSVTRNHIARLLNDGVTQSLTVATANRIEWLRGGASPETPGVTFEVSTDGGVNWVALGAGVRISGGWELTGLSLPPSGQVRARARISSGRQNGSSSLIETNVAFSGFPAAPPVVITTDATNLNVLTATLTATINPSGSATTAQFEYGTTTNYGTILGITLSPTNGATAQNVSAAISGLTGGTTYHFRAVASNSAGITYGSNVTFATLTQPEIAVEQPAGTNLTDGVSTVSFPTGMVSNAGSPLTFVIRNLGVANLTGLIIAKDGAAAADFIVDTNGMSTTVAPGGTTTFAVTFTPTVVGTRTAAIHLTNNDSDENPFDITLTGFANKAGDLDTPFNPNASDFVNSTAVQVDGKIVIIGNFTQVGGTSRTNVARLNADGTLDASFNPRPDSVVNAVSLESSQKILLGGYFTNVSAQARNRLARLNSDGSAASALNSGANANVYSLVPQPDGKLILCGAFTNVAGLTRNRLARLNTDGTVDAGFNPNADDTVTSALLQPSGQIIIWGNFNTVGGQARNRIARLNVDGTVDGGFNPNPDISVYCVTLQADGKILVGGSFTGIAGGTRNYIARLNSDGTIDNTFNPGANEYVNSIVVQTDGKILIGGNFTVAGGAARNYLARFNTNGAIDTVFNPGPGNVVSGLALQSDGKILIGGSFTLVGGQARNRIARLLNDAVSQTLTAVNASRVEWLRSGALPEAQSVSFDVSIDGGSTWIPLGAGTRLSGGWELTGLSLPSSGQLRAQGRVSFGAGNNSWGVVEALIFFSGLPAPEIVVEQPAGTNVVDNGSRDFGSVLLGSNAVMTFTISNAGNADLTGLIITKNGAHSNDFTVNVAGMSATLTPLASTTFTVTFVPGALGARTAAIHIANNDADENPFDISLNGTGVAPEIVVEQPAGTGLVDGAATINFGSFIPGASSAAKTFVISNSGSATLFGLAVTRDGTNSADFAVDASGVGTSLPPGGSATFTVTFTPPIAGARTAAVHIASSDADENPFDINLTGTGLNQSPVVANPIPDQNATATLPFSYSFPTNTFSDPDVAQTLTLTATRTTGAALPAWLTFTAATRTFSGTPSPSDAGTLSVRVTATDNGTPALLVTDDFDIVVVPIAPSVVTSAAASAGAYGATLEASINPNGLATTAQFEYGTSTSYGASLAINLSPNNGTNAQPVSAVVSSLVPNTTYHFRATATNGAGGNAGLDRTFITTPPPPGIADTNFNPSSVFGVLCVAMQPDGKILAGGDYAQINNRACIPRLNPDGTSDLSFNPFNFSRTFTLVVLPDGKILAGGSQANAFTGIQMVRLNSDGSLDNSLDPFAFNNYVWSIAMQPDGKAVVGGSFTTAFGQPRNCLARINADGTLDASFNPNANGQVDGVLVLPDGKLFVCGNFTQIGGLTHNYMARLNADGTPDNTFVAGHNAAVIGAALQADGKILVIKQLAFTVVLQLGRLNLDGSWDMSFISNATHDNSVYTMAVQTDGKIVVGGDFTQMAGQPRSRIARLNANGSIDPLFNPGANHDVLAVTLQADGRILVGGQFTNINGQAHQRLARLNNDFATEALTVPNANRIQWLRGGASPEAVAVTFEMSADGGLIWTPLGAGTRISGGWEKTGFTLPPSGLARARAIVAGGNYGASFGLLETTVAFSGFAPSQPYATTLPATAIAEFGVTLHASVNPAGSATTAQFEYGTNLNYGSTASITLSPNDGAAAQQVAVVLSGLMPATHYFFRVTATNGLGGAGGSNGTFTTQGYPEIAVEEPAGTTLTDGSSTIGFGTTLIGSPVIKTFIVTNLGTTNLAGLSVSKNGAHAAEFVVGALTNLIAPGGSATFDVTFNPASPGAKTAAIHIASNDADENPFDINLTGNAITPEIVVESPPGTPLISNLQGYFDEVFCGQGPRGATNTRTVLIRNIGSADLNLTSLVLAGPDASQFTLGPLSATNLPPGSNATFTVYFHPTRPGGETAYFQIFNNDVDENPFQLQLRGILTDPDIVVEQPSGVGLTAGVSTVDYGNTPVGTPIVKTFIIRNSGLYDLTGLAVTKTGANASEFSVGSLSSFSVYPGTYATFDVTFNSASAGSKTAAIHIASSDPDENPFDLTLTGTGVAGSTSTVTNGSLVISNAPGGTNFAMTVRVITVGGTNYLELHDANNAIAAGAGATQVDANTIRVPVASVTNQLQITGGAGDDHFVIDATGGCPLPPGGVSIDGGGQTLNGADTLAVLGASFSVQYDANNIGAGVLSMGCGTVNFTGLEPVDFTGAGLTNLVINVDPANLFASPVTTTLSAMPGAGNQANTRVAFSGGLELMDFGTLTGTLTITGDSANVDTIVVQGVGANFAGHLAIVAQGADSVVLTNGPLTLGAGKNFDVTAGSVTLGAATVVAGTVTFHGGSLALKIGGLTPGVAANQYSRLTVTGAVALSSSPALNLTGSYVPQPGNSFTLIANDGSDPVTGTFAGLPEGATLLFNGATLRITYTGGDGNDVVLFANTAPVLNAISNYALNPGAVLNFTATATDADQPANELIFSLVSPPSGASINAGGQFNWRPTTAQANTTNVIKVRVQDGGSPSLSATNSFTVMVNPLLSVALAPLSMVGGAFQLVVSGPTGPDYIIMASGDLVQWTDIATNLSPVTPFQFNHAVGGGLTNRFYRVRLSP